MQAGYHLTENPVFCVLPWLHVFGSVDGVWGRCCVDANATHASDFETLREGALGCSTGSPYAGKNPDLTKSLLEAFHSPELRQTRANMLNGQSVDACKYCYLRESQGGRSYRQTMNQLYRDEDWENIIGRTTPEGEYTGNPCFLDIRWSNLCNLRCVMCSYPASSRWHTIRHTAVPATLSAYEADELWCELEQLAPDIRRVYLAGGEPLLHANHLRFLRLILSTGAAERVDLVYNTNLTVLPEEMFDLWPRFKSVEVGASCDGVGKTFEAIRVGADWASFEKNLQMAREIDRVTVRIAVTPQRDNADNLVELVEWATSSGYPIDLHNLLHYPIEMSLASLPEVTRSKLIEEYSAAIHRCSVNGHAKAVDELEMLVAHLAATGS